MSDLNTTAVSPATAPVVTGLIALASSLTVQEWAAVVGIMGVATGVVFGWRRDRREQRRLEYELRLRLDRRAEDCARCNQARRLEDSGSPS